MDGRDGTVPVTASSVGMVLPSDEELVAATREGDPGAYDQLVQRWERKIHGAAFRVLGSHEDAREVSQEAFLKAYRAIGGFEQRSRFSSWLYQIALNLCRDRLRRKKGRHMVSLDEMGEDEGARLLPASPSVHREVERLDLAERVARAVAELPSDQREVIVLKEYQELTFAEIAEVLGTPVSTVKTRLYRGLSQLRRRLQRDGAFSDARPQEKSNVV
jgi:RNA polymerase sigma-70 factor (ECF subfamily)